MRTFRFLEFPVYLLARELYVDVIRIAQHIKDFSLQDQIRRASLSVVLNIAEGSARVSDKEFARFLMISLGSINEVVACLDMMCCNQLLSRDEFIVFEEKCSVIAKQLGGLVKKIKSDGCRVKS